MPDPVSEPQKEPQQPPAAPEALDVEQALPAGDTFPRDYVERLRGEAAKHRVRARDIEQRFGGTSEEVDRAARIYQAAQTDDGLKQLVSEASQVLGVSEERVAALWAKEEAAPKQKAQQDLGDPDDLDVPLTKADLNEVLEREVRTPLQEAEQKRGTERKQEAVLAALDKLGLQSAQDKLDVLNYGNTYVNEKSSPSEIADAIVKGHADWTARLEAFGQLAIDNYRKDKANDAYGAVEALSGGAPASGENEPPPKNVAEAGERLRRRFAKARGL